MSQNNSTDPIADDGLYVDEDTTKEELESFLRRRVENPVKMRGVTVWNFSSYNVDRPALRKAIQTKLEEDEFIVPFQVAGTWGLMYHLLPRRLKEAEILVYHGRSGEYRAFENFIQRFPQESEEELRYQLSQMAADEVGGDPDG